MVFAGQLRRQLAAAAAGRSLGRDGRPPGPGGAHVFSRGPVGSRGPGQMASSAEPLGPDRLPAADGADAEPPGVSQVAAVPACGVAAAGRRTAVADPGPDGPLDRRGAPRHGVPAGGGLRPVPAATPRPRNPLFGTPGLRGKLPSHRHPDGGRQGSYPHRLRGFGEPVDGAPFGPARGADGRDRSAARAASGGDGAGGGGGGPGHGANGAEWRAGARVRWSIASAAR